MEDDVDIYADLPSFSLNLEKNDQGCNCKELKKELSLLVSKLENIQRIKENLEKNLSSLLKTAKTEIARKDKMIDDLRKKLDDITFRRGNRNEGPDFSTYKLSHQHTVNRKYEDIPLTHPQENKTELHQIQLDHDEYKNKKPQIDVKQIPTLFGERLQKRIMEDKKEEKKKEVLLNLNEAKTKDIPKNNVVENNKENGSQLSRSNNNESNIERHSNSEPPERNSYRNVLKKRTKEENDTRKHKRLKLESNEDKTTTKETDYNHLTRYDLTDNPVQYEKKDSLVKFEDRPSAAHRAASEYRDTKQNQSYINGWRNDAKNNSARDDSSNIRNDLADNLKNSRIASTSNHATEEFNSAYKKNGYRYSPSRKSYSRSRSDYESSSSHRLRERFSRTHREKKYDNYKYDSRYRTDKLKRNYESEENDGKTKYRRGERGILRDRSRYSSSDAEDRENSSYRNKKYEKRRMKRETADILNDKRLHENNKAVAEINFRESSSRTIVDNIMNYSAGKNIDQHKVKNKSEIKSKNLIESTSACAIKELDALEEGEILDSPEKKSNSARIYKGNKMEENNISIPVENKNKDISVSTFIDDKSISLQNENTKQLEVADTSIKEIEVSCPLQENSKDWDKVIQLNSNKSDKAVNEVYNGRKNEDACKAYITEDLMDSTAQSIGAIEQVCDSNIDDNKNADKTLKDLITEAIETAVIKTVKIKEMTASNINSVTKIKELGNSNIESVIKKEKTDNLNNVKITQVNNSDNNSKIDGDELRSSIANIFTKEESVLNCDNENKDKNQEPIGSETLCQMSNKSNVEMCLNDHNYVQNPFTNVSDLDATQKPSSRSECGEAVLKTTTSKETKVEKPMNVQPDNSVKRTISSIVKKKKDQSKGVLISHRRKAVILSDSNASMTVLMNTNEAKTSVVNNCNNNDVTSKPRACRISRVTTKTICK